MQIKEYFEYLAPLMLVLWCVSMIAGRRHNLAVIISGGLLALVPFKGLSLSDLILSLNPVFSVGSTVLLFHALWKRFAGHALLSDKNLICFAAWNVILSALLYASYLGFMDIDIYPLGYGFSALFVLTAVVTIALFLFRSPLAYIFLIYIAAYDLRLFMSDNFWDYMTDMPLFIISLVILLKAMISGCREKPVPGDTCCSQAGV